MIRAALDSRPRLPLTWCRVTRGARGASVTICRNMTVTRAYTTESSRSESGCRSSGCGTEPPGCGGRAVGCASEKNSQVCKAIATAARDGRWHAVRSKAPHDSHAPVRLPTNCTLSRPSVRRTGSSAPVGARAMTTARRVGSGEGVRMRRRRHATHVNIDDGERWISLIGGSLLLIFGLSRGGRGGGLAAFGGGALIYRAARGHSRLYT